MMVSSAFHAFMRALGADGIEQVFIDATDQRAVDQRGGAESAIAQAINRLDREMARGRGAIDRDALLVFEVVDEVFAAHGLAGLGAAEFDHALASGSLAEVVVKGDCAVNFGLGHIERVRDHRHGALVDIAERVLQRMEDRQRRAL